MTHPTPGLGEAARRTARPSSAARAMRSPSSALAGTIGPVLVRVVARSELRHPRQADAVEGVAAVGHEAEQLLAARREAADVGPTPRRRRRDDVTEVATLGGA